MAQLTASHNFSADVDINAAVKGGDWKVLFDDSRSISSAKIINTIGDHYSLDPEVVKRLDILYASFIGRDGNTKEAVIGNVSDITPIHYKIDAHKEVKEIPLKVHDINL